MFIHNWLFAEEGGGSGGGGNPPPAPTTPPTLLGGDNPPPAGDQPPPAPQPPLGANEYLSEGKFQSGFSQRLPDDLKPYGGTLKKFEGVPLNDVLKSYGELEKKIGQRVAPPLPDAKPEEIAAWRKVTGAPEKPEGYDIKKPEDIPAEYWSPDLVKGFSEIAHKHHLSPAAAQELVAWWNNEQKGGIEKLNGSVQEAHEQAVGALQKEWGEKFGDNVHAAKRVAAIAGLDVNDPEIGNNPVIIRALHSMSAIISDDRQVTPKGGGSISMSPAMEADDIQRNPSNPYHDDYMGKNGTDRQKAVQDRMLKLRQASSV